MTDACCILLRGSIRYKGISVRGSIMTKQEAIAYITKELAKCAAELAPAEYQGNVTAKYDSSGSSSVSMKFETENLVFKAHNSGCFDNDEKNCNQYGRLYTWASAMGRTEDECGVEKLCNQVEEPYRGICPEGFHIPSVAEFEQLSKYVRDCGKSGNLFLSLAHKLNASLQYNSNEYIDEFSFGAFLGGYGYRTMDDTASTLWPSYLKFMDQTIFWTIDQLGTPKPNIYAWMWYMFVDSMESKSSYDRKDEGFSIRCLKD